MAENHYITRVSEQGSVYISEDVVATIVAEAVREVDGIGGFATSLGGEIADRLGGKKPGHRGVKISFQENEVVVEAFVLVKYGVVINDVAMAVQEKVSDTVEAIMGVRVKAVNVTVCGIAFNKEK
ncbi:MAG: Asp23/Gls24 family envelope stress response protein [Oscillospiraceae bacterium]|nr:Asp23/Gls24 family envelope stress response protein [Oscillospiraceae bacterium]